MEQKLAATKKPVYIRRPGYCHANVTGNVFVPVFFLMLAKTKNSLNYFPILNVTFNYFENRMRLHRFEFT